MEQLRGSLTVNLCDTMTRMLVSQVIEDSPDGLDNGVGVCDRVRLRIVPHSDLVDSTSARDLVSLFTLEHVNYDTHVDFAPSPYLI